MHTASGEIQVITAPTSNVSVPITQIPNNIGVAINSKEILGLEKEVEREISAKAKNIKGNQDGQGRRNETYTIPDRGIISRG